MKRHDHIEPAKTTEEKKAAFYDHYDYSQFWKGRDYESQADAIAVVKFLNSVHTPAKCIIDVGGGLGRLVPYYAHLFEEAILLDPSAMQLTETKARIGEKYPNLSFVRGIAEHIPVADNSVDTIVCVRVSHHIPEIHKALEEYKRILVPGGYLILDVANKLHAKARIKSFFNKKKKAALETPDPIEVCGAERGVPFVNHNPHAVKRQLIDLGFDIVAVRSVSNLRSRMLKKLLPLPVLVFIERLIQHPLGRLWFGPSAFILARKRA